MKDFLLEAGFQANECSNGVIRFTKKIKERIGFQVFRVVLDILTYGESLVCVKLLYTNAQGITTCPSDTTYRNDPEGVAKYVRWIHNEFEVTI